MSGDGLLPAAVLFGLVISAVFDPGLWWDIPLLVVAAVAAAERTYRVARKLRR